MTPAVPVHITYRDMDSSLALDDLVRNCTAKLEQLESRMQRCDVVIERPHQHMRRGQQFQVRIALDIPGTEVIVSQHSDEDAYLAVRDAFQVVRRQLEACVDRRRSH